MRTKQRLVVAGVLALSFAALTGCAGAGEGGDSTGDRTAGSQGAEVETLTVSAAASLKRSFDEIAEIYEAENPGVSVQLTYDGSSTLATQIVEGAPVDVFASADERNMDIVVDEGLATDPQIFAANAMTIAVPAGNPGGVKGLADLADVTTVLCAPEVPCGASSETLLENAGVTVDAASLEQNVTAVLQKVAAGEADAGLVYYTDVVGQPDVDMVMAEGADRVLNNYPIAALTSTKHPDEAQAFIDLVLGDEGQRVLYEARFGAP